MKSPFAIFRKHQKVMMVILVGLSLVAFVLFDAFSQSSDVPPTLLVITVMLVVGGAGWIAGMPSNKSKEYGGWGLVLGAAAAFCLIMYTRPAAAVRADFGTLSAEDLRELQRRREIANRFVVEAIRVTSPENDPATEQRMRQWQFRFTNNPMSPRDIVLGEILRREAERVGLVASDDSVTQYVQEITSHRISTEQFNTIRAGLHLSENQLYEILREQLQARVAAEMLYSPTTSLPPEKYWEYYRQLFVKQTAEVAALPVKAFIDESATPPPAELNRILAEYRENYPNQTKELRLEEGRPGLYQPRRAKLAFLEATFADAESQVAPVTDADIQARFEEQQQAQAARGTAPQPPTPPSGSEPSGPALPGLGGAATPPEGAADTPETPATPAQPGDSPATPETPKPASPEGNEAGDSPAAAAPPPGGDCNQEGETPAVESDAAAPAETAKPEAPADAPAAESTSAPEGTPPAEANSAETPAATTTTPAEGEPPLPQPTVPVLDDALKETIRQTLVDERVAKLLEGKMQSAADHVQEQISRAFIAPEKDAEPMTAEKAAELAREYAAEQHLYYGETPYLSSAELAEQSEEHPIGMAQTTTPGREDFIARAVFATGERDLYRPIVARSTTTKSWFVCWKVGEQKDYAPENLNDERVRDQAVAIWRALEARKQAETRARELAQLVRDSGQPMSEALGEQRITGSETSLYVEPVTTGEFHYQGLPNQLDPDPFTYYFRDPQIMSPTGVENAGPAFMETVFNELAPGEVGVAANFDQSHFYVVKVLTRSQATPEEWEAFRQRFLEEPLFEGFSFMQGQSYPSVYERLARGELLRNLVDWQGQLLREHGVQMSDLEN